jgi:hypothetical protein
VLGRRRRDGAQAERLQVGAAARGRRERGRRDLRHAQRSSPSSTTPRRRRRSPSRSRSS